jgi:hypothetical protein
MEGAAPRQPTGLERAGRFVDNVVRGLAQGATFGFADEIAAGARTGAGLWGDYGAALAEERGRDAEFRQESPVAATAANVVGGIASPLARLRVFNPGRAASIPGAMVRGAGAGAAAGGVAGFGEGEGGFTDRASNAAVGAGLGAAFGAALPPVIAGARAGGEALARRVGLSSGNPDAERIILRDLGRDGVTPEEVLRRSRDAGAAPVAIADLGGENVVGAAAGVSRAAGRGREEAARLVTERGGRNQADRLAGMVRGSVSGDDFQQGVADVVQRRAAQAAPLYEQAYSAVLPRDLRLQRFLNDPDVRQGIQAGLASARREALSADVPFDPAALGVRITARRGPDGRTIEDFQLVGGTTPTRLLDAAKRGLDELIEGSRGENGRATSRTRELTQLREAMLSEVDRLNPAFAQARAAYRGQSELLDAARVGRDLVDMRPRDFQDAVPDIRRMSAQEREFLRLGLARGLLDRIENATDAQELTRLNRLAGSSGLRERIGVALNDPREMDAFMRQFEQELRIARTNQAVNPRAGSQTMPLSERAQDLRNPPGSGAVVDPNRQAAVGPILPDLIRAGTTGGITAPVFRIGQRIAEGANQSRLERNVNALAPMLFNPDQRAREEVARALIARRLADERAQRVIQPAISGLSRGAAVGSSLYANE